MHKMQLHLVGWRSTRCLVP